MSEGSKAVKQKDKILYIEPNDLPGFLTARSLNGDPLDNIAWNPEDMNIFVDLQVVIPSRQYNPSELKEYGEFDFNDAKYQSILSGIKLGGPNDNFLTDDWTVMSYQEIKANRAGSKEMLGINSIQITFDSHMYPVVTMNFTDVRGASLMQPQEQRYVDLNGSTREGQSEATRNFFASIFKFPYPRFLLSVKGIYGTCVTFVLSVSDFKSSFNSETGNFDVVIKFIGHMYGLYTDIPMNYILIAPYIGSKKGGMTHNEYWEKQTGEGGAFRYNEMNQDGAPISTFLEFYSKYHRAAENHEIGGAYGKDLSDIAAMKREISFLKGDEGIIGEFYDKIPAMAKPAESVEVSYEIINDPMADHNVIFYDTNVRLVEFDDNFVDKFVNAVENYKKEYPDGFFKRTSTSVYTGIKDIYELKKRSVATSPVNVNSKEAFIGAKSGDMKVVNALNDEVKGKLKTAFVYSKQFKTDIEQYCNDLEGECSKKLSGASEEVKSFFKEIFDFSPTIENVMRMLFAHVDTFINYFYATVSQISGTRTLATLNNFRKDLTDIESSSGENAHVPPFTAFFKEKSSGEVERMYPGENSKECRDHKLNSIAEVKFVESILEGIGSMSDWQERYMNELDNDDGAEDTHGGMDFDMNFKPVMLSDIYYDGANPYDSLRSDLNPWDILYFFICRYYQYAVSTNRTKNKDGWVKVTGSHDLNKFADIEADNFIHSKQFKKFALNEGFRRLVGTTFKDFKSSDLEKILAEREGNRIDRVFSFSKWPIYEINRRKWGKFTVHPREDGTIPMKFNGVAPISSTECNRESKEGFNLDKYGEEYIKKFSDALQSLGLYRCADTDFSYENRRFAGGKVEYTTTVGNYGYNGGTTITGIDNDNIDGDSEIIPLEAHDSGYYPFAEKDGNSRKIVTKPNNGFFYYKSSKVVSDTGKTLDYSSFDDFIKNADESAMWIPSVRTKIGVRKVNLLIPTSYNLMVHKWNTNSSAFVFLRSLFFGIDPEGNGDKMLSEKISKYFNANADRCLKMMWAEYLLLCGIAYTTLDENDIETTPLMLSKNALIGSLCENERRKMAERFLEWANGDFNNRILSVLKSMPTSDGGYQYTYSVGNDTVVTATTDVDEYGGVSYFRSALNSTLVGLYRTTVLPIHIGHLDEDMMPVAIDDNTVRKFFKKVSENLDSVAENAEKDREYERRQIDASVEFNEDSKNAIYYTLKNLYDRWLSMLTKEDFTLHSVQEENMYRKEKLVNGGRLSRDRSEFSNFIYVDSFYNDISKKFLINPESLFKLIGNQFDGTTSYNILEFIGKICQDNKLLFRCLPVYSNVYSMDTFAEIFTPHSLYDGTSRTGRRIGNTYMIMYTYEPSHLLDIEQDKSDGVNYGNDSFDIADSFGDITQEALEVMKKKDGNDSSTNYGICAFGVTAAKQNQSYFTKINVGMDNPRVTDYSIMNKFQLADMSKRGGTVNGIGVGQDLYSVYSNRSYDCSVEMLGCANIMPMMYFQLNNVPMFKGVYMITKVEHNISNNTMTTKFTGTRQPKRYIPMVDNVFSIEALNESINRLANRNGNYEISGGDTTVTVRSDGTKEVLGVGNPEIDVPYNSLFPKGSTFYSWAAVKQMFGVFRRKNGEYERSAEKGYTPNCGRCATAVQTFLMAGFNGYVKSDTPNEADNVESVRAEKRFNNCNGYDMWRCLKNYGFDIIASLSTIDKIHLQAGDVCVTKKYKGSAVPIGVGHVCMYTGDEMGGFWVSDFKQNSWWVYGPENKRFLNESDVLVFRFMGTISTEEKYFA